MTKQPTDKEQTAALKRFIRRYAHLRTRTNTARLAANGLPSNHLRRVTPLLQEIKDRLEHVELTILRMESAEHAWRVARCSVDHGLRRLEQVCNAFEKVPHARPAWNTAASQPG